MILNWNGWKDTVECLESVFQSDYENYAVVVVDNGSQDDSLDKIREYCSGSLSTVSPFVKFSTINKPIDLTVLLGKDVLSKLSRTGSPSEIHSSQRLVLIANESNLGFAGGINLAVRYLQVALDPDYFFMLNNDAVVETDVLRRLVRIGESSRGIGMVGPKICRYDDPKTAWAVGGRIGLATAIIGNLGEGEPVSAFHGKLEVDYVSACALLVSASFVNNVGLMDPEYFMYFEETDWAMRARPHGYRSVVDCDAKVYHKSGASILKTNKLDSYYFPRSKLTFLKKRVNWYYFPFFLLAFVVVYTSILAANASRGDFTVCRNILKALRDSVWASIR